jgi:16S rRNA (guanine527-N7)-methyltransferase
MNYDDIQKFLGDAVDLTPQKRDQLQKYLLLLQDWNQKINLTAIDEENAILEKHFLDCLIPTKSPYFKGNAIGDIGTGAGFPGLVFAIVFPDKKITLVDATLKKCNFLKLVCEQLGLKNVLILNKRAEDLTERDRFDIVTARAVAPLNELLEILTPWAKIGGTILAMKGNHGIEELSASNEAMNSLGLTLLEEQKDTLPICLEERVNLFFKKNCKTQMRYPRKWAEIKKKPL